jgi:hypothetical protein
MTYPYPGEGPWACTADYDEAGHRVSVTCTGVWSIRSAFTAAYDGDALVALSVHQSGDPQVGAYTDATWSFGESRADETECQGADELGNTFRYRGYDPDGLVMLGHPQELDRWPAWPLPEAPDALVDSRCAGNYCGGNGGEDLVTFTYDGPPRQGTRTRTGSDGSVATFVYDEQGRLLEMSGDWIPAASFVYQGDLLVEISAGEHVVFEHDSAGNLLRRTVEYDGTYVTDYTYDCWEGCHVDPGPVGAFCGDPTCDPGENGETCPTDCPCGDGTCDTDESYATCPADCRCGDGTCDARYWGENLETCPQDCYCGNATCDPGEKAEDCPADCYCGNGTCDRGETSATCAAECYCYNGTCDADESSRVRTDHPD